MPPKIKSPTITLVFKDDDAKQGWLAAYLDSGGDQSCQFYAQTQKNAQGELIWLGPGETLILEEYTEA